MAQIKVLCETSICVRILMDEFQATCSEQIDRVRPREFKLLLKSGDVVELFDGSNRTAVLGLAGMIPEEEFRKKFGLPTNDRLSSIQHSVSRQYSNMGEVSDW